MATTKELLCLIDEKDLPEAEKDAMRAMLTSGLPPPLTLRRLRARGTTALRIVCPRCGYDGVVKIADIPVKEQREDWPLKELPWRHDQCPARPWTIHVLD